MKPLILLAFVLCSSLAMSCPICHTNTGQLVRAGIFNSTFYLYLFYTLLPFVCFFVVVYAAYCQKLPLIPSKIKDNHEK